MSVLMLSYTHAHAQQRAARTATQHSHHIMRWPPCANRLLLSSVWFAAGSGFSASAALLAAADTQQLSQDLNANMTTQG